MHASFGKLCYSFRTGFRIFTGVCKECYPSSQSGLYAGLCSLHPSLTFGLLPRTGLDQHTSVEYSSDILYIGETYLGYSTPAIAFTVYSSCTNQLQITNKDFGPLLLEFLLRCLGAVAACPDNSVRNCHPSQEQNRTRSIMQSLKDFICICP